jgi:hypothetical protein
MKDRGDMADLTGGIGRMLRNLGMGDIRMLLDLQAEWDEIAGRPWAGVSRPMGVSDGELLVEASDPGTVSLLRYATGALVKAVEDRFGVGPVDRVRVVSPPPGGPR